MFRKVKKFFQLIKYFIIDGDNLFLYLLLMKAESCLEDCNRLEVVNTEEIEDLIFHIRSYLEIPNAVAETSFPEFRGVSIKKIIKYYKNKTLTLAEVDRYGDYIVEVETQRAIERDFIFESAKALTFGFTF